jgi:hypothetical protein
MNSPNTALDLKQLFWNRMDGVVALGLFALLGLVNREGTALRFQDALWMNHSTVIVTVPAVSTTSTLTSIKARPLAA